MPQAASSLAKFARPRLHHAVPRERLFSHMDQERAGRPALCVVGPPGAGKTTLVGSWLDTRGVKGIWYQVDAGDADLPTFFYYLSEATRPFQRKGRRPLPMLTPEYAHDVAGFGRRYFRDLFATLPLGGCLVLDNYQEVPAQSPFHQLVADALPEVPPGITLIVVSRRDPPDCYAHLIANDLVAFIDWDALRLTLDETQAILARRGSFPADEVTRLHEASGGWAAGLTLMLEGHRRNPAGIPDQGGERDMLFGYFAGQIFAQVPEATRRFLLLTALLPQVPVSLAQGLTEDDSAAEILEGLYRRHLFTHRRPGSEVTYWYHALFRDYLLSQGAQLLTTEDRDTHRRRAARLLESRGMHDDAYALFLAAHDWDAIARLAERQASGLLAQGRGQTLRDWILSLPAERLVRDAWLRYWLGMSNLSLDQREAREQFQAAYTLFSSSGNAPGQALAAAGVLDAYYFEWADFGPMRLWVERLEVFLDDDLFPDAPEKELRVSASLLVGILYGVPTHPSLHRCVTRVSEMRDERLDVNSKLKAATFLLSYCNLARDQALGQSVHRRMAPILTSPEITPLNELWWHLRLGHYHTMLGHYDEARAALTHVRSVAQTHGLSGLRSAALLTRSYELVVACMLHDEATARRLVAETEALAKEDRPMDAFHIMQGRTYLAQLLDDAAGVWKWGAATYRAAQAEGMLYTEVLGLLHEAHGVVECRAHARLDELLNQARRLISGTYLEYFECEVEFLSTFAVLQQHGRESALPAVRRCLLIAQRHSFHYTNLLHFPTALPEVLDAALMSGTEPDYVRDVIRRYHLRALPTTSAHWPRPVSIRTLGAFEVRIGGDLLHFTGRTPRKPLTLLKAIVAFGGVDIPLSKLADALWDGDDGDAAKQTLGVTLVRLRKLLGQHDVIVVANERISLNRELCWVDTWAFESAIRNVGHAGEDVTKGLSAAMTLYRGAFLPADPDEPWSVQTRLRCRAQFTQAVADLGVDHESRAEWERAIDYYRRGLEADDLMEEFYLGLMRCYRGMHRPAEGLAVYRRLRQTLSVVLGVAPSPASEAIVHALRKAGEPRGQ